MKSINSFYKYLFLLFFLLLTLFSFSSFAQDVDIIPYLKQIERGELEEVCKELPELKEEYPNHPSIMFLEGVLTENGQDALLIYQTIVNEYPDSEYADAALYRIFSYYYALGLYESADKMIDKLISDYPNSPYIRMAKSNKIPGEVVENRNDAETYDYTIQAGAFTDYSNAASLKSDVEQAGFYCEIQNKIVGGTTFNVVYIGKFNERVDAESMLKIVNNRFNINGRIVDFTEQDQ